MTLKELAIELPSLKDEAKNLWGEEYIDTGIPNGATWQEENILQEAWKHQLYEMIESDDPELYLRENS